MIARNIISTADRSIDYQHKGKSIYNLYYVNRQFSEIVLKVYFKASKRVWTQFQRRMLLRTFKEHDAVPMFRVLDSHYRIGLHRDSPREIFDSVVQRHGRHQDVAGRVAALTAKRIEHERELQRVEQERFDEAESLSDE